MPDFAGGADVYAGVVVDGDGDVKAVLVVLLDGGDGGGLALEENIEGVGAATGIECT